jgi:hypothetical protein
MKFQFSRASGIRNAIFSAGLAAVTAMNPIAVTGAETARDAGGGGDWWPIKPKLKWLYASSGVYMDRWGGSGTDGNGAGWISKDRALNPPQTLTSLSFGGAVALTPRIGLSLGIPLFFNTFDPYTSRLGGHVDGDHRVGVGDLDIGVPIKFGAATVQPQLTIPGPYTREYLVPWTGFGVYRGALGYPTRYGPIPSGPRRKPFSSSRPAETIGPPPCAPSRSPGQATRDWWRPETSISRAVTDTS